MFLLIFFICAKTINYKAAYSFLLCSPVIRQGNVIQGNQILIRLISPAALLIYRSRRKEQVLRTESSAPRGGITPGKRRTRSVPARDGSTSNYDHLTDPEEGVLDREYGEEVQWSRGTSRHEAFPLRQKARPVNLEIRGDNFPLASAITSTWWSSTRRGWFPHSFPTSILPWSKRYSRLN